MGTSRRAAIIGTGRIGNVHRKAIAAVGGTLAGVVWSSPARTKEVSERWGITATSTLRPCSPIARWK